MFHLRRTPLLVTLSSRYLAIGGIIRSAHFEAICGHDWRPRRSVSSVQHVPHELGIAVVLNHCSLAEPECLPVWKANSGSHLVLVTLKQPVLAVPNHGR